MTSPCSVSLRRPSTEPGAWPRIARLVGPPPRPIAPPRPWNSVSSTPRGAGHRRERALGPVEHPGGGQEPGLLVRVGVAEHHLLAIAPRREVPPVGRVVEERVEDRAGGVERRARLEQRHDVEDGHGGRRTVAGVACAASRASSRTSVTSDGRRGEADRRSDGRPPRRTAPGPSAIARNVSSTSPSVTPGATSVVGAAAPRGSPRARRAWTAACWRTSS